MVFLAMTSLLLGSFQYQTKYAKILIETYICNNKKYQLEIYEIGEPKWPFGETNCRFILKSESKTISSYDFYIFNDGARVHKENFEVKWANDYIKIIVDGEEQAAIQYYLYYDGMVESVNN